MVTMAPQRIEERVARAAERALAERRYVSPIDVLIGLGWLAPSHVDAWRQGRVADLESLANAGLGKLSTALGALQSWPSSAVSGRARPPISPAPGTAARCGSPGAVIRRSSVRTAPTGSRRRSRIGSATE